MTTLLDIAKRNLRDEITGIIEESFKLHPEVLAGQARTIKGTSYHTLVRTALGAVAFRNANEGSSRTDHTYENRLVETFIMDPIWFVDKAVADLFGLPGRLRRYLSGA